MSSTQSYYKDRLGFDPNEPVDTTPFDKSKQGYEDNLVKFKGLWEFFADTIDERDAIQKKTFTKWVNKHLKKHWKYIQTYTCIHTCGESQAVACCVANRHVNDLFVDLQDGLNLISLLEVLTGEHLPRERGQMRFHMLQNVQMALDFLRFKKIKLVNIRAEDIVDGNPKLTLGLIWTIILHFQISDIVVGAEPHVSAKEALLNWARHTTSRYPGVRVHDFTSSWRDGLAFNAIIHRNRPDLVDWRGIRSRAVRERLETAFYTAEREYGVTRLLDPEDVDTHEIDEKSIITYISSLYDVFPEPPAAHPLHDNESQARTKEYRELATSLHLWMKENQAMMSDRTFPSTLIEMKKLATESSRFRNEEVPVRQREKQKIQSLYRELQKIYESVGEVDIDPELHIDNLERNWSRLMIAHQERDNSIQDEIKRLDRLQRIAEKVHREMKRVDTRLEDLEVKINEEARRLERLHPLDAKHNVDLIEQELRLTEENIQSLFTDVQTLRDGRYPQASDLHKRVTKLHQRWVSLRSLLHSKLITPLASMSFPIVEERTVTRQTRTVLETRLVDTNTHFRALQEAIDWCRNKLKQIQEAEYGADLSGVKTEIELHQREHRLIEQFHSKVEHCINAQHNFHGDELALYTQHLNTLQKLYAELLSTSNKRVSDLETLLDFVQSCTNQLLWLSEKEKIELSRDWASKELNTQAIEQYYESLMSELEKREIQLSAVQDRGESLLLQHHPGHKTIEAHMAALTSQWAWLLQLTLALETHLRHATYYHQFFKDVKEAELWLNKRDELLNTVYSQSEFSLDEGERLLRGMQELREELNAYGTVVQQLSERAADVVPLKQRRQPVNRPLTIHAVCAYKQNNVSIEKGDQWILHDNSGRIKWHVSNGSNSSDCNVPGVVFLIPPPDKEALEAIERLKRQFDRTVTLWQRKQLRMRQNMIFATIKVVRSWDLAQFLAMGADQRNAIRKALNEDAEKLLKEGDPSDPQLRRLRREIDEVNRLFDEFERRAREEEESKNAIRIFTEQASNLQAQLDEAEHVLNTRIAAPIPRDLDSLEHLAVQHREFENRLKNLTPEIDGIQSTFRNITRKTPALQSKLDKILTQWNQIWNSSHLYNDRLKSVEVVLSGLEEANTLVSEFELKLASYGEMPNDLEALKNVHQELINIQNSITRQQPIIDQLNEDCHKARRVVEKSRHHIHRGGAHHDLDRLDNDVKRLTTRWNNLCAQLVDRLHSCEAGVELLQKFTHSYQTEVSFVDDSYGKLNHLTPVKTTAVEQIEPIKNLFTSIVDRKPSMEQVNVDGGRFIREAKIYDLRLQHYCDWLLDEVHPSMDASSPRWRRTRFASANSGEVAVARDLDILNHRYQALLTILHDRLKQLLVDLPDNKELEAFIEAMEPTPLRTYRTEFDIYESASTDDQRHSNQRLSNSTLDSEEVDCDNNHISKSVASVRLTRSSSRENSPANKIFMDINNLESNQPSVVNNSSNLNGDAGLSTMQFSEIRSLKRVQKVEEGIGTENLSIIDCAGIVHPVTGQILTVGDAIRLRILDVRTGRISLSLNNKLETIPIEKAVKQGLVDSSLADKLLGPCGIVGDGPQLTLLEAIQRELLDAERGPMERVKVNNLEVLKGISISDAVNSKFLDSVTGQFKVDENVLKFEDAFRLGYLRTSSNSERPRPPSLSDALLLGIIDDETGNVLDRNTGEKLPLDRALENEVIRPDCREIVDALTDSKLTLAESLKNDLIKNDKYMHGLSLETLSLQEAQRRRLIIKPFTLKDCIQCDLITDENLFLSPTHRNSLTLLDAIASGVLDAEEARSICDTRTDKLLTLTEALANGIITLDCKFVDKKSNEIMSLKESSERGLLASVSVKCLFDIDAFKENDSESFVSLNSALNKGLITEDGLYLSDPQSGKTISIQEAIAQNLIRSEVADMLNKKIGIFAQGGEELTVFECVIRNLIDPKAGQLIDPVTKKLVPLETAVSQNLISKEGASILNSFLSITLTTQTVAKVVKKYSTTICIPESTYSYDTAVSAGLIDDSAKIFTHPSTNEQIPLEVALEQGLITDLDASMLMSEHVPKEFNSRKISKKTLNKVLDFASFSPTKAEPSYQSPKLTPQLSSSSRRSSDDSICDSTCKKPRLDSRDSKERPEKNSVEMPPDGWLLADVIAEGLFDPECGLLTVPGTDRLVSFEECLNLEIINPLSALVVDLKKSQNVPLLRGIEKHFLDSVGHFCYPDGTKITMKEAIDKNLIIFLTKTEIDASKSQQQAWQHTSKEITDGFDQSEPDQINPLNRSFNDIIECLNKGNLSPGSVKVKDPVSGLEITIKDALKQGVLNKSSGEYDDNGKKVKFSDAVKLGLITAAAIVLPHALPSTNNESKRDSNESMSIETSYPDNRGDQGQAESISADVLSNFPLSTRKTDESSQEKINPLINPGIEHKATSCSKIDPVMDCKIGGDSLIEEAWQAEKAPEVMPKTEGPSFSSGGDIDSELTRSRLTTDPNFQTPLGVSQAQSADLLSAKPVILQKMRRKTVSPSDAVKMGVTDEETAKMLTNSDNFISEGQKLSLSEAVSLNKVDGESGAIKDPLMGDILSIKEAMKRGILDSSSSPGQFLIPVVQSLSIPAVFERGLYENGKIVHPETRRQLSLKEAIVCGIVDSESQLIEPKTGKMVTLEEAILSGCINEDMNTVQTHDGCIDFIDAFKKDVFIKTDTQILTEVPLVSTSSPVVFKRGLTDAGTKETINSLTDSNKPSDVAIQENSIMNISTNSCPSGTDDFKAADSKVKDVKTGLFHDSKSQELVPVPVESQSDPLKTKNSPEDLSSVTELVTTPTPETTTVLELEDSHVVGADEAKNVKSGKIIPLNENYEKGIGKSQIPVKSAMTFKDALELNRVDVNEGVFLDEEGKKLPIQDAVKEGLLDLISVNPGESNDEEGLNIVEAFESVYDQETETFIDPKVENRHLTFEEAVNERIIDPSCQLFDFESGTSISVDEGIKKGILDRKTGKIKSSKGGKNISVKDAAKLGLMAFVGAPILAGKFVFDSVKDLKKKKSKSPSKNAKIETLCNTTLSKEDVKPDRVKTNPSELVVNQLSDSCRDADGLMPTVAGEDASNKLTDMKNSSLNKINITKSLTPQVLASRNLYCLASQKFLDPNSSEPAQFKNLITDDTYFYPEKLRIRNSESSKEAYTLQKAFDLFLIDESIGTIFDPNIQERVSFFDAAKSGLIYETTLEVPAKEDLSPSEAIMKGSDDEEKRHFVNHETRENITTDVPIKSELLDVNSSLEDNDRLPHTSKDDVKSGIVDIETETPNVSEERNQEEVLVKDMIFEVNRPSSLKEALNKGLYDKETGLFLDPKSGDHIPLQTALESNVIDSESADVRDTKSFIKKKLSLKDAIKYGFMDGQTGKVKDYHANAEVPLQEAFECGLLVERKAPPALPDAIRLMYDKSCSRFIEPNSEKQLTLRDAIKNSYVDPHVGCCQVENSDRLLSVVEACHAGLIDKRECTYTVPETNEVITLCEALDRKLIVDNTLDHNELCGSEAKVEKSKIKSENLRIDNITIPENLATKAEMGLYPILENPANVKNEGLKSISEPKEMSLLEAINLNYIDPDIAVVKTALTRKFISVSEAVLKDNLDVSKPVLLAPTNKDNLETNCVLYNNQAKIYLSPPITFDTAVRQRSLDSSMCVFTDQNSGNRMSLIDALNFGYIDPDSVMMKDVKKNRLLTLPEGFGMGLIDTDSGNVLDTNSYRLYKLPEAVSVGLVFTRGLSLLECLDFGLYNPTTGFITDPFCSMESLRDKRFVSLADAIFLGIVDPRQTSVKDNGSQAVVPLTDAISSKLIDSFSGKYNDSVASKYIDLLKARDHGYILPAEARQAVEEKYRLTNDTLSELLRWIGEIEDRLANQDVVQEDLDQVRNQINILKLLKEELESQSRSVTSVLDQVRQLVATGGDYLSRDEVNHLEKNGKSLKNRYDYCNDRTDKLLRRLIAAKDELNKFKNEVSTFTTWMDKARRTLEDKEQNLSNLNRLDSSGESIREFVSDVIAHQADLRFITMAAQKFFDESKEYLNVLNDFRTSLPSRLSHIEPVSSSESIISGTVSTVTAHFKDLLARATALSDRLSGVGSKQREYRDALEKAKAWLREAEPKANKLLSEPIAADPITLEDQLTRTKALNNEFVAQGRLIDNAKQATDALIRSLEGQISPKEARALEIPVQELEDKYKQLCNALANKCQALDTALVQSQGVQDALDSLINWLNDAENSLKNLTRPASLHKERLEEQLREHKVLQSDIDSHRTSVDSVAYSAQELISTASNPRLAKKIESKLRDVTSRFEKLLDKTAKRGEFLSDIHHSLTSFNGQATTLERWLTESLDQLPDLNGAKIDDLIGVRDSQRQVLEQTVSNGKTLINKKDVTDTGMVRDRVKTLENLWKELNLLLDEKQRLGKACSEQLLAYEKLRDQVIAWLNATELRVNKLEPVAVELETIKRQADDLKPIVKEHRDYGLTVDKVNDLGNAYDAISHPDLAMRRRSSVAILSPTKRVSISTGSLRRPSQETSPSPIKGGSFYLQSPVSPGGSSGFGSRRSSQEFHLDELTPVQQELNEINNRYHLLGVRLSDRQTELDQIREEVKRHLDHLKSLSQFLDKVQRTLPKESIPQSKEEADKTAKQIKIILEEMYEKQSLLDSTKAGVNDLLRRKPSAFGVDILHDELADVSSRWKSLHDACKNRIQFMEDLKDFHDTHDNLSSWLSAKDRMMTVLGPISSDSRMVQSQVQQVQVLREEFRTQQPQLQHLTTVGKSVLSKVPDPTAPDAEKISAKLSNILQRWADLLGRLEERAHSLGAAANSSREFDAALLRLRDALQSISDQLDDIPLDKEPEEQLRKVQNLERQLEGQRPLLADLEASGAHLCDVLSDPASKADIQSKLAAVARQYNTLQKKLDHRKAEIEALLRDGRQFEQTCAHTLGWLSDELGALHERLLVSADREILQQQLDFHEPIYKDVLNKEHEVIMLLNKGRELLARSLASQQQRNDTRNLQRDLDKIQQHWDKLRKEAVDRHTRLQTCMEHCKKYYRALESFIPWLSQAENKLDALRPDSFKRRDVERQLRELATFRNDVWKHSGEFENLRTLGETFLAACDVDKELVKQELAAVKTRWDKLNNELLERIQWLEETARRLADFSENLRDLGHNVQRCEDKLASHDSLGGAARDPKMLERIKALREEAAALKKPLQGLRKTADDLCSEAAELGVGDASHLRDDVDNLGERLDQLAAKLDDRCSQLQSASTALAQYNERAKNLSVDLSALENEIDNMKPPDRDIKIVRNQLDEVAKFIKKLAHAGNDVARLAEAGEQLIDNGFAPDAATTREQAASLIRQLNRLDERAKNREDELEKVLAKLQKFHEIHSAVMDDITHAGEELRHLKPVGSEVEAIKSQQDEFNHFRNRIVEPLTRAVDDCNRFGQNLVSSAASGVNTSGLEKDLEKLNDKWNALKEKLNERDRKLDVGLLQSGKFQEALDGFAKWLADTEEMVANQKPPSADYKVVKAQLQEQKFLKKMLLDRQHSMSSLVKMGKEVAANADVNERKAIERQLHDLATRFETLQENAAQRMDALEQAMVVAKQFQDKLVPILDWLDKTEKKVKDMELIPTDEEKIQQRIREHDALHKDILRKKPDLTELTDIASNLMALVGEDEAATVADKLQDTADRYANLVLASDNVGQLLQASRAGLRHLVLTYQDLQAWMEGMENRLNKYRVLPVHPDKLIEQMEDLADLTEEIANRQNEVDSTVDSGLELMKHISSDEAIQLKDKLDSLQRRYNDLTTRGANLLKHAQEALPLVQQFHNSHNRLVDWMMGAESQLQTVEPREEDIMRLELDIQEFRPVLENINLVGAQLCQISPGEGAATIEGLVTRDNRRFDSIVEQIQRKAERIHLSKQRSMEVIGDIDDLLDWFRMVENQLREAEPPSSEPDVIRVQLKEHKALNDDISSQKGRVRDVLSTAKKVLRESTQHDDTSVIREKMEDLREMMETVSGLSSDRLGILEQALPLAEHFHETHSGLSSWLDDMEHQVNMLAMPALRPDQIAQQQDKNELFLQSISEHKPFFEKLNKTGEALIRLCNDEEGSKVQDILDSDNARYNALRSELRARQQALEKALQESSQFSDKLEGMLRALANTADQVAGADPISAHPPRIRDQIDENNVLIEDLDKREEAFQAVKKAANDVIKKAPNASDPAVKDIKRKLDKLNSLWNDVQRATGDRGKSLEEALAIAERFWDELQSVMARLRDLQHSLNSQEPPAVQPEIIKQQREALKDIKAEIDQTKPEVEHCRATGQQLMKVCGEPDKPEVKKHIEDLDNAWDTITALFAKREENLIHAMEKAMEFHETLQDLLDFLDQAEERFAGLGPIASDINAVKKQISQLKQFKNDVDPHMVKVEALNRQAQELTERTSAEQAAALKKPLASVNRRWDELLRGVVERQRQLENALLRLGQFQHAVDELMAWIDATNRTLDNELKPVFDDPQVLEVELAKLKVLVNDIQAHQSSVDTLNDAGRQLIESSRGSDEASSTQDRLNKLNKNWRDLLQKAADRQTGLEEALRDAQRFAAEIQDLLSWLSDIDSVIAASKPVGGLPETASEQLERFMEVYRELEENRPKVEAVLDQGQEYLKKTLPGGATNLQQNLKTLKQRWDSVTARANDKKIKLEIALKEATEFHDSLQAFVDWLTNAEKVLCNLKPVSRILQTILGQIEEHKAFQKDVGAHRETMLQLDKKGTHLKYFSQKQDVILIKNLLISVQHRWERVVSKSTERTRALDHGYKEAKEFHDAWSSLMNWLNETEQGLDDLAREASSMGNNPEQIKQRLAAHREFQRALSGKQATYDATMRTGKALKDKAPKTDEPQLRQMMNELKEKWTSVCAKSVDRQRKLEEALLYCGQFKDAIEALMDWLRKTEKQLSEDGPVHGDLDTVMALVEQHKVFEEDLENRADQMDTVQRTGHDLMEKASAADAAAIRSQLNELTTMWSRVTTLTERKTQRLEEALKEAEQLHKSVHALLEWLSDAEMKLRFVTALPDDEQETRAQLTEHEKFMREMAEKEYEKDQTIALAQRILQKAHPDGASVIKHWITIIQSRWDEVSTWAKQREQRLRDHLRSLQDLDTLLEELLAWLARLENQLLQQEAEPLPEEIPIVERLIEEHREFMEQTSSRQHEVDSVCKARQIQPERKPSMKRLSTSGERSDSPELGYESRKSSLKASRDNLLDRRGSRASPSRDKPAVDALPHYGPRFPPKGSKAAEPQFRNPRCRILWDSWRNVWILAWERQRRLQEHLNYLKELEKVKNFSWDEWRKRFLNFMNHKKSRLTDLFRKMDKNNIGLIPRDDFIDGIIKTKFDTSKLEMGAVADMFDQDGAIDWQEFIAALRPDWQEKKPDTEAEKIHDEVKRLVMLCTCRQKFRVFQVGEGKYRFGDSQKLRLVRILRSTVMVRVGGGWVALDEFLIKNDPCRVEMLPMPNPFIPEEHEPWCPYGPVELFTKGRTNIELREQFILADGVSQSMSAFKPKSSPSTNQRSLSLTSNAGPITKVRERSARSVPMGKTGVNRTAGTPDSLSDNESSPYSRTPVRKVSSSGLRKSSLSAGGSLPGSRNNSRPPSRTGSKPPSRHGSNLSLDSTDDGTPSRIPRRSSTRTSSLASTPGRKLTVPSVNGGSTSRNRSPSGTRSGSISRASSIPTLTGVGTSRSRIPVFVGLAQMDSPRPLLSMSSSSSSGTRTPSGSSTPVTPGSRLTRKSSGASDTATGLSRRDSKSSTPTDQRAPFRL
ncbi:dystonin isoform X7 [Bemisia tabaci]|uniref:dystonin isoform X7 n=1 Tax=Bemisia tabaci TaxID=7038 RepID=UPI003B28D0B6